MADQSPVQSVERTFSVIELLCKNGESGITELSAASGLNKTTVFRLLSTLVSLGYAAKNPLTEKYRLTLKFLKLSAGTLSKLDIRRYA
ncbi:MAG TPA: IclR family transcriptional regulator, partial [Ruminococcaceae bacterium]|nr:IclR family transcriptional regulator [Oscillospiraceae bacterium]